MVQGEKEVEEDTGRGIQGRGTHRRSKMSIVDGKCRRGKELGDEEERKDRVMKHDDSNGNRGILFPC